MPSELEILAFPSREFGAQEFADDARVATFAASRNFPGRLVKIGNVLGDDAPELWKRLRRATGAPDPTWNFRGKFLVSKTGVASAVSANDDVEERVAALVAEKDE